MLGSPGMIMGRLHKEVWLIMLGWLCVVGWQSSLVATAYIAAQVRQMARLWLCFTELLQQFTAIIAVSNPSYAIQGWQGTLFTIAVSSFAIVCNSVLIRKLPLLEGVIMTLHVVGFFAFVVVLWVMGPRGGSSVVTTFTDNGWGSTGLSSLVGILGPISSLLGADSAAHLSEELRDAAWVLPRSMIATALCNYTLGLVMIIVMILQHNVSRVPLITLNRHCASLLETSRPRSRQIPACLTSKSS